MPQNKKSNTFQSVLEEVNQGHPRRRHLYRELENALNSGEKSRYRVVAFFTSFTFPVLLGDKDADMLEEVLQNSDMSDGQLILLLNTPGGDALTAERIINICRNYAKNNFSVIVPKMAKSAGTMICLGAEQIGMSLTSELGPIDPQILINDENGNAVKYQAAHEIIESYEDLMRKANSSKGRIEPFLQQLSRFDARDIRGIKSAQALSESIAINSLKRGRQFRRLSIADIKKKIKPFLDPKHTKVHGRPIYYDTAKNCGLDIKLFDLKSEIWEIVWKLYVRLDYFVSTKATKVIESSEDSYIATISPIAT